MTIKLLRCKGCGKIYKITNETNIDKDYKKYYFTDFGDKIINFCNTKLIKCICCNNISNFEIINCEEWIAELVYKVKGN